MTKKQLKQLAKQIASYEIIIQTSDNAIKVNNAKERITQLTDSADLEFEEMIALDELISEMVQKKI